MRCIDWDIMPASLPKVGWCDMLWESSRLGQSYQAQMEPLLCQIVQAAIIYPYFPDAGAPLPFGNIENYYWYSSWDGWLVDACYETLLKTYDGWSDPI